MPAARMKFLKCAIIAMTGGLVLLIGIAMIILPGPAIVVIPAGLAILSVEFAWARRWLDSLKAYIQRCRAGRQPAPATVPLIQETCSQDADAERGGK